LERQFGKQALCDVIAPAWPGCLGGDGEVDEQAGDVLLTAQEELRLRWREIEQCGALCVHVITERLQQTQNAGLETVVVPVTRRRLGLAGKRQQRFVSEWRIDTQLRTSSAVL
jgi:hypothetical protein